MRTTRRNALLTTVGLASLSGCEVLEGSNAAERREPDPPTATDTSPSTEPSTESAVSGETTPGDETETPDGRVGVTLDRAVDALVSEHGGEFRAVSNGEVIASHPDDLGRVIDDAQRELSGGYVLVAASGPSSTEIGHGDDVTIGSLDRRTKLVPAEEAGDSFETHLASNEPDDSRLESLCIDMENRGGPAVRSEGFTSADFDDLVVRNTAGFGGHGLALVGGRSADVRDCRFTGIGDNALRVVDSSDVSVRDCESVGARYGIYARDSSGLLVRGFRSRETRFNSVAMYDYTENWKVVGCRAVDGGHTPFAASAARNGSFVGCLAEGITADREGGFEVEYKAGHDSDNREAPVEGCSVISCTAVDCNMGFYAREDRSNYTTDTEVVRPKFVDCTAVGCETGLFVGGNVVEAIVRGFDAVDCATDVVDEGTRTMVEGRSENEGDPAVGGQWNGHAETAARFDVTVEDTASDTLYKATTAGTWQRLT